MSYYVPQSLPTSPQGCCGVGRLPAVPAASPTNLLLLGLGLAAAFFVLAPTRKKRSNPRRWVKGAIKHPGALTATVRRRYGAAGFTTSRSSGRPVIKRSVLTELGREPGKTGQRARLAITMRRWR